MNPLARFSNISPLQPVTAEQELSTFSDRSERYIVQPRTTMNQELISFFAQSTPQMVPELIRIIAGYAEQNLPLAMRNAVADQSLVEFNNPQHQEMVGAIMCAFSASPVDVDPVHKQILLNSFNRGGSGELVQIFKEMSRIKEKVNIDRVKFKKASLMGPCELNYLSAVGVECSHVNFVNCQLRGANLNGSKFRTVGLFSVNLRNACLSGIDWQNVRFLDVDITGVNTNDKRLIQFMENCRKKDPRADIILNGELNFQGLVLEVPEPTERKCSIM